MYHPMLTFALAQTRVEDLQRDLESRQRRAARRPRRRVRRTAAVARPVTAEC